MMNIKEMEKEGGRWKACIDKETIFSATIG